MKSASEVNVHQRIFALQHIDSGEFICLLQDGHDYLASFTDGDSALEFRTQLGLLEHVNLFVTTVAQSPFHHFWLDGESIEIAHELSH